MASPRFVFLLGLFVLLVGLAVNPVVVGRLLSQDGRIDDVVVVGGILVFEALCAWVGILLLVRRRLSALLTAAKVLITAGISLVLFECVFRVFLFGPAAFSITRMSTMHPLGESGLIRPSPHLDVLYELRPDLDTWFKLAPLRTNSQGLRDKEYAVAKPEGTFRAVVVGDSFTMPTGVPIEEAFHTVVEDSLNAASGGTRYEVINFGVAGYDPGQYLAMLERRALGYDPDLVLFCMSGPIDMFHPRSKFAKPYVVKPVRNTLFTSFTIQYLRHNVLNRWFPPDAEEAQRKDASRDAETLRDIDALFGRLEALSAEHGIPVCIVIVQHANLHPEASVQVMGMAEAHGLYAVDMAPAFANQGIDVRYIIYRMDNHPNARANRMFGDRLYAYLRDRGLTRPGVSRRP